MQGNELVILEYEAFMYRVNKPGKKPVRHKRKHSCRTCRCSGITSCFNTFRLLCFGMHGLLENKEK